MQMERIIVNSVLILVGIIQIKSDHVPFEIGNFYPPEAYPMEPRDEDDKPILLEQTTTTKPQPGVWLNDAVSRNEHFKKLQDLFTEYKKKLIGQGSNLRNSPDIDHIPSSESTDQSEIEVTFVNFNEESGKVLEELFPMKESIEKKDASTVDLTNQLTQPTLPQVLTPEKKLEQIMEEFEKSSCDPTVVATQIEFFIFSILVIFLVLSFSYIIYLKQRLATPRRILTPFRSENVIHYRMDEVKYEGHSVILLIPANPDGTTISTSSPSSNLISEMKA